MASISYTRADGVDAIIIADATESESHIGTAVATKHPVDQGANITDHVRSENDTVSLVLWFSNHPTRDAGDGLNDGATLSAESVSLHLASLRRRNAGNPILVSPGSSGGSFRDNLKGIGILNSVMPPGIGVGANFAANIRTPPVAPRFDAQEELEQGEKDEKATVQRWSKPFDRVKIVEKELRTIKENGIICTIDTHLRLYENMVITGLNPTVDAATGNVLKITVDAERIRTVSSQTVQITQPLQTRGEKQKNKGTKVTEEANTTQENRATLLKRLADAAFGGT